MPELNVRMLDKVGFEAKCFETVVEVWGEIVTGSPADQLAHLDGVLWGLEMLKNKIFEGDSDDSEKVD